MIWVVVLQPPAGHDVLRLGIFQAIGIFVLSVSGHSSLPVLRNSMKRPQVSNPFPSPTLQAKGIVSS
jgi:hypothetical protein